MFLLGTLANCLTGAAAACACSACTCISREAMVRSSRMAWSFVFSLSMIIAWVLRDFAKPLLMKIPWIVRSLNKGDLPSDEWFGAQAVYRVSMGNLILFGGLALVMIGVHRTSDRRDRYIHHGSWMLKAGLWVVCMIFPFFLPTSAMNAYAWIARFGSPLFLLVQMIIIVDMTQAWNDDWVEKGDEDERWLYGLLTVTLGALAGCAIVIALSFHWFAPSDVDCSFNLAIISLSLVLVVLLCLTSFHPAIANASLFPASAVGLYICYLGYSALMSEPRDYECNLLGKRLSTLSGVTLAGGMAFTLLSVVYSAFRAGSNTQTFSGAWAEDYTESAGQPLLQEPEAQEGMVRDASATPAPQPATTASHENDHDDQPVPYCYAQFYTVFALASMYIAMLMTGWGATGQERDRVDVGWVSVWVKITTQWVAAALYCWTLMAPTLFPDRVFA